MNPRPLFIMSRVELDEAVLDAIRVDRGTPVSRWMVIKRMLLAQNIFANDCGPADKAEQDAEQAFTRMKMRGRIVEALGPWGGLRKDRWVEND